MPAGERGRSVLEMLWARPTCEVNGIVGGYVERGFKTVIPAKASAKVSFRLVGDQDPERIRASFRDFVRARLPADCSAEFTPYAGGRAPQAAARRAVARPGARARCADEWGVEPALVGGGGSIPVVADLKEVLGMDSLMVGFGLDDDRIHSPNEKYELSSFHGGIRSWARILAALAAE